MSPCLAAEKCVDCGKRTWQTALVSPYGPLNLCNVCADEVLTSRRQNKKPALYKRFLAVVYKVFGRPVPMEWEP